MHDLTPCLRLLSEKSGHTDSILQGKKIRISADWKISEILKNDQVIKNEEAL